MRFSFIIIILLFLSGCRQEEKVVTVDEIKGYYGDIINPNFLISKNRSSYGFTINSKLPKSHLLSKFAKRYNQYINYLAWNYTLTNARQILKESKDSISARSKYIKMLQTDSLFSTNFLPLVYGFLKNKNIKINNYLPPFKNYIKKSQIITIGSNFFYPDIYDSVKKSLSWYICVGNNPFFYDSSIKKNPSAEAFCFMTLINPDFRKMEFHKDFGMAIGKITNELDVIPELKERLMLARKRMPEEMAKSKDLENVLMKEYQKRKNELPFEIVEN